ncbi:MAG: hypothetical protein KF847_14780 [Pirellulales bacterium]|nr:hypothetical protein [Pirellulales bacterium]
MDESPQTVDHALAVRGLTMLAVLGAGLIGTVGYRVFDAAARRDGRVGASSGVLAVTPAGPTDGEGPAAGQSLAERQPSSIDRDVDAASYAEVNDAQADDQPAPVQAAPEQQPVDARPRFVAPRDDAPRE